MLHPRASPTFSQAGEDRITSLFFGVFSSRRILTYADVGAAIPIGDNNTFLAYSEGGSGLLVEADPLYGPQYLEHRPRDAYRQVAVVPSRLAATGRVMFARHADPGHSGVAGNGFASDVRETFEVPCVRINTLLAEHFAGEIDLLSIDIEGLDAEVLAELDLERFRPKIIIAENVHGVAIHREMMESRGYQVLGYTFINTLYFWRPFFSV